jgi:hypothetical protein
MPAPAHSQQKNTVATRSISSSSTHGRRHRTPVPIPSGILDFLAAARHCQMSDKAEPPSGKWLGAATWWGAGKEMSTRRLLQPLLRLRACCFGDFSVRLFALIDLYIHPLYVLVSKILSSILNSPALIYSLYHPLSTLSTMGPTCHFI